MLDWLLLSRLLRLHAESTKHVHLVLNRLGLLGNNWLLHKSKGGRWLLVCHRLLVDVHVGKHVASLLKLIWLHCVLLHSMLLSSHV